MAFIYKKITHKIDLKKNKLCVFSQKVLFSTYSKQVTGNFGIMFKAFFKKVFLDSNKIK